MIPFTLQRVANAVHGTLLPHGTDTAETVVDGPVDTDSRQMVPGGIFVAKPGEITDGHLFVADATQAGAAVAIVQRPVDVPVSQIVVDDAVAALADLARAVVAQGRTGGELRVIGITGSNGKTSTKNFLAQILSTQAETVAPRDSFNNHVGAPLTMLRVTEKTRYLVCEFGASAPGEIASLADLVAPDVGIVLMVGLAHSAGFGGIAQTAQAKSELVRALKPGGVAVLNADDSRVAAMAALAEDRGARVRTFGRGQSAQVRADEVTVTAHGTRCTVSIDGIELPMRLRILGEHQVMNALAALAAATELGVPADQAIAVLQQIDLAERWRMQPLGSDRVRIINDAYNASPDSMAAALRTLAQIAGPTERTVAVLGAMTELGESAGDEHDRVGLLAVRLGIKRIVVVGPEARRLYLAAVSEGSWDGEAVFMQTADDAYDYLITELRDHDRVLVKSSHSAGLRLLGDRLGESFS